MKNRWIVLAAIPVALFLVIVSGAADKIIYDLFCNMGRSCSDLAIRDYKQVGVLVTFILGITGFIGGALLKNISPYAIMLGMCIAVFVGITALWGTVSDELSVLEKLRSLQTALYIALVIFTAVVLPAILLKEDSFSRLLPHFFILFAVSLLISVITGLSLQGLIELAWPNTQYASDLGTSKFVITPAAVVICTTVWGALLTYPFYYPYKWDGDRIRLSAWCAFSIVAAVTLAFGFGFYNLLDVNDRPQSGLVAMALLLPAMLILFFHAVVYKQSKVTDGLVFKVLFVGIAHASFALLVISYLKENRADKYQPFHTDFVAFGLTHMLSGLVGFLTLLLVHIIMRNYTPSMVEKIKPFLDPD